MKKLIKLIGIIFTIIGLIVFISFVNHKTKLKMRMPYLRQTGRLLKLMGII